VAVVAEQIGLFDQDLSWLDSLPDDRGNPHGLRYYQQDAIAASMEAFRTYRSALIEAATGTGKTITASALIDQWQGRVLFLAHREELITQAATAIGRITGEMVGIEQAELHSGLERVVCGSVQTVHRKRRLERLAALGGFSLIIVDEAHRSTASTYRKTLSFFPEAKVLGLTATPDRSDKVALGKVFETVAYRYGIEDGIQDGYLVPVEGQRAHVEEVDLSGLSAQDFTDKKLDDVMLKAVEGIVQTIIRDYGDRRGPVFFPGVMSSKYAAERLNALRPGCAASITQDTDPLERKRIVRAIHRGEIQYLCNVSVVTEGFDWPSADFVGMGAPTKSRLRYAQQAGRGLRVLPGVVDHLVRADERRDAIAQSAKPMCVIADFVGNSGKHDLCSVEDVLGGKYTDDEKKEAKKRAKAAGGGDPIQHLEEARRYLKHLRDAAKSVKSKVQARTEAFDPFNVLHVKQRMDRSYNFEPATDKQVDALTKWGIERNHAMRMSKQEAVKMMNTCIKRKELGLASYRQLRHLQQFGINDVNIRWERASAAMRYLKQKGWGKKGYVDPDALRRIIDHKEKL